MTLQKKIKVVIDRAQFLKALKLSSCVTPDKPIIPIYSYLLTEFFKEQDNQINVIGSNGNIQVRTMSKAADIQESFSCCIPAGIMIQTLSSIKDDEIQLFYQDYGSKKQIGILAGKNKYNMPSVNPSNFGLINVSSDKFMRCLSSELTKAATNASAVVDQKHLNDTMKGVHIKFLDENRVSIYGASQFYMTRQFLTASSGAENINPVSVPVSVFNILKVVNDTGYAEVFTGKDMVKVVSGGCEIIAKCYGGKYPDVDKIFAKIPETRFEIRKDEFESSLVRTKIYSSNNGCVEIKIKGSEVHMSSHNYENNLVCNEILDIQNNNVPDNTERWFNASLIQPIVNKNDTDSIYFFINSKDHRSPGFIMPTVVSGVEQQWCIAPIDNTKNSAKG